MGECWMLSRLQRPARPLSDVMVAGYPTGKEGPGAVGGGDGREGNGHRPPRGSVDYCEQVSMAAGGRQRADQVDVDVAEKAVKNQYLCWL